MNKSQKDLDLPSKSRKFLADMRQNKSALPMFDSEYYSFQLPEFARTIKDPLVHFITTGEKLGLSPHPIYDAQYVLEQIAGAHSDTLKSMDDFSAFVFIQDKQISPNRLFSPHIYLEALAAAGAELPEKNTNPASHFLTSWTEEKVEFSEYFDIEFYLRSNPQIASGTVNPLDHYFRSAIKDRSDANPMFHSGYYLLNYVLNAEDPLIDFLESGHAKLNLPNPYAEQELVSSACITPSGLLTYISNQELT